MSTYYKKVTGEEAHIPGITTRKSRGEVFYVYKCEKSE
jgi:hypothetical protein